MHKILMNTKLKTIINLILCSCSFCSAQITFQKTIGGINSEMGYVIQQTNDGGYISGGTTQSIGAGSVDLYLISTDNNGDTVFTKTYGGTGIDNFGNCMQTADGGFVIFGSAKSFDGSTNHIYLVKTNSNGDTLWTKIYGNPDILACYYGKQTNDHGYIMVGQSDNGTDIRLYALKTDSNGIKIWDKSYGGFAGQSALSVCETNSNGFIIAGYTNSFGSGQEDIYLIKTNIYGDTLWTKTIGGTGAERCQNIQPTIDGNFILVGNTTSYSAGNYDVFLLKIDTNASVIWSKTYGGIETDFGQSVEQTHDGGYILTGSVGMGGNNIDALLIKTNPVGDTLWTKTYGGTVSDQGNSVRTTADNGYVVCGWTNSFRSGAYDFFIFKTDSNGNSGCNQSHTVININSPVLQSVSAPTIILSTVNNFISTPTIVKTGGSVNLLCLFNELDKPINDQDIFSFYPNPVVDQLTVFSEKESAYSIQISDLLGREIYSSPTIQNDNIINLKYFASGIYLLHFRNGANNLVKKIVIKH